MKKFIAETASMNSFRFIVEDYEIIVKTIHDYICVYEQLLGDGYKVRLR